jgi:hypothetical protein
LDGKPAPVGGLLSLPASERGLPEAGLTLLTNSVVTAPGSTMATPTPTPTVAATGAATGARLSKNPSTANLAAQEASLKGWPTAPRTLLTVKTRPPEARRWGMAASVTATTPKKLTSMTLWVSKSPSKL